PAWPAAGGEASWAKAVPAWSRAGWRLPRRGPRTRDNRTRPPPVSARPGDPGGAAGVARRSWSRSWRVYPQGSVQVQGTRAAQQRRAERGQGVGPNGSAAPGSPGIPARPAREILAGKPQLARRGGPSENLPEGRAHEALLVRGPGPVEQLLRQ